MLANQVTMKRAQWNMEAEVNFVRRLKNGEKMHREQWANGMTMVGHDGARANQMIPLERAIEIWTAIRDGKPVRIG